jgi:hypothetical protein
VNCCVVPFAIEAEAGATVMEVSVALVTVNDAVPIMAPDVAVMVTVVFVMMPVATPVEAIVASAVLDEAHVAVLVRFCVVLSL